MRIKKMITDLDFKTISPFQYYKKSNTNVRVLSKDWNCVADRLCILGVESSSV